MGRVVETVAGKFKGLDYSVNMVSSCISNTTMLTMVNGTSYTAWSNQSMVWSHSQAT